MALIEAIKENDYDLVSELIYGFDTIEINCRDYEGKTALMYAVEKQNIQIVNLLIENGADVNLCDECGTSALLIACDLGNIEICDILIKKGANKYAEDAIGYNPFMIAITRGFKQICELLIHNGVDVNNTKYLNYTPLMIASMYGKYEICELLIKYGAKANAKMSSGDNALSCAFSYALVCGKNLINICKYLIDNGAEIPELSSQVLIHFQKYGWDDLVKYKQEYDMKRNKERCFKIKEDLIAYVWNPEREFTKWALMDEFSEEF